MVLGIHRVDGHERDRAPILAMGHRRGSRPRRLGNDLRVKDVRNLVRVDGNEADRSFIVDGAEPLADFCRWKTKAAGA